MGSAGDQPGQKLVRRNIRTTIKLFQKVMKTIFQIAKTELALLFYSPIAWFLLIAFLFQSGLAYTGMMENYITQQEMGGEGLRYLTFLTSKIFGPPYGIWS